MLFFIVHNSNDYTVLCCDYYIHILWVRSVSGDGGLLVRVCTSVSARARPRVFNKVRRARFLFFFALCPPRAYWRNAEKGQVVTVVTGTAAVTTGKRVRRLRRLRACRRRAIQRCVLCAKKISQCDARADRRRRWRLLRRRLSLSPASVVGRGTVYRLELG